jgi:hypothetical protein
MATEELTAAADTIVIGRKVLDMTGYWLCYDRCDRRRGPVESNDDKTQREGNHDHETDDHDASHRRWSDAGKRRRVG